MKPDIVRALLIDKMRARIPETQGPETGLVQLPGRVHDVHELFYPGHHRCR